MVEAPGTNFQKLSTVPELVILATRLAVLLDAYNGPEVITGPEFPAAAIIKCVPIDIVLIP
jgi:hypothetical protein